VLISIGLALVAAGLLYMAGLLDWFGRLHLPCMAL
jgi:hypothetical protein